MGFFFEKLTTRKVMLFIMLSIVVLGSTALMVTGEVYKVGDSMGWTTSSNSSYAYWASSKTFRVHDVLLFQYNATNNNVILVSRSGFQSCNTSAPMKLYNSGNDSFTITSGGHYYFTSNFTGHCQGGQKLEIRVLKSSPSLATPPSSPATSPSSSASHASVAPVESKALAPSPTQSKASSHDPKSLIISTIGVTISGLVTLAYGYA